jgi:tetratricopeptide (TPR) repeat protein
MPWKQPSGRPLWGRAAGFCPATSVLSEYQDAAAVLRQGLTRHPQSADLLEQLARLEYTNLRDYTNAHARFRELLRLRPNHPNREEYTRVFNYLASRVGAATNAPATNAPAPGVGGPR